MSSNTLLGVCVALGGLGIWNTWTLHQVNQRLEQIEKQEVSRTSSKKGKQKKMRGGFSESDAPSAVPLNENRKRNTKRIFNQKGQNGDSQSSIDLTDPDVQDAIAEIAEINAQKKEEQRRKSKMEAYKASLKLELEKFSNEKEYDSETAKSIETILEESTNEWTAVRAQVREGEISWMDARTEFKAIGDETEAKVTEFISPEDYQELRSRLWGDWGR